MLKGIDTPFTILEQILSLVFPSVHITLTDIVSASNRWQFKAASNEEYSQVALLLQQAGYEASVYRPASDPLLKDSCGLYLPGTPQLNLAIKDLNHMLRRGESDEIIKRAYNSFLEDYRVGDITLEQIPIKREPFTRIGLVVDRQPHPSYQDKHIATVLTVAATSNTWRAPGHIDVLESL